MSQFRNEIAEASPFLWAWQARRGTLDALTGQPGTLVRAAAATASRDSYGNNGLSIVRDRPVWTCLGTTGGLPGLAANTSTLLHWGDWNVPITADICGLIEFVERGPTASGGILHLGGDTVAGQNRVTIYYAPNSYRLILTDGSTAVASTASVTPSVGQIVRLRWRLRLAGGQHYGRIWQSIGDGPEVAASEVNMTALTSYGTSPKLRLNSIGTSNQSAVEYRGGVIARGDLSADRLLEALAP